MRSSTAKKPLQQQVAAFSGLLEAEEWMACTIFFKDTVQRRDIITRKEGFKDGTEAIWEIPVKEKLFI